jgi:RNA polymerase sigma factor (TIGR02999 family)
MLNNRTPLFEQLAKCSEDILSQSKTDKNKRKKPTKPVGSVFTGVKNYSETDNVDFTRSLNDSSEGVFSEAFPLIYDELRRHAVSQMSRERYNHTLQPTALVHEAWLRITEKGKKNNHWKNRAHFFGAAACAMRRILVESIRRKKALKRAGDQVRVDIEKVEPIAVEPGEKILLIDEALKHLEVTDPEKAKVVTLKFFGGHSNAEVAEIMGIGVRTVERHWAFSKVKLYSIIKDLV